MSLIYKPLIHLKKSLEQFNQRRNGPGIYERDELHNPGEYRSLNCFYFYKCIFIHIPKTGGKSISKTLFGNFAGGHKQAGQYIKIFGENTFNRYYKFAFVRNPWDRLYSAYSYYLKSAEGYPHDEKWKLEYLFYKENLSHLKNFEQFVIEWLNEQTVTGSSIYFIPQYQMITAAEDRDKILVDFVGRFENMEEDFKSLCIKLNRPAMPLQRINVSNPVKNSFIKAYTNEMIHKVAELYAKDIEMFEYSFPA